MRAVHGGRVSSERGPETYRLIAGRASGPEI
jgi:hypothetical protein